MRSAHVHKGDLSLPLLRIIRARGETLAVVCDEELLGKTFRQGELRLEVRESFYRGEKASVEDCLIAMQSATIGNLVGSIVEHAVRAGIIEHGNVLRFKKVPHAQFVRL